MNKYIHALFGTLLVASLAQGELPPPAQVKQESVPVNNKPIVAATWSDGGMEVVITPIAEKLAPLGLKPEDLRPLQYRCFVEGEWQVIVKKQKIDLEQVTTLEMRKLQVWPFKVDLPDGRQVVITPQADPIAPYHVTGRYFEEEVRRKLTDLFLKEEPSEINVLWGLIYPGKGVPNFWGRDRIHTSMGEPLKHFAEVKIEGAKGPQVADLGRMKAMRSVVDKLVEREKSTLRSRFEAKFGKVKENENQNRFYPLAQSRIQIKFAGEPPIIDEIYYLEGLPVVEKGVAAQARAVAQVDRDFLLAFLSTKYRNASRQEKEELESFLDGSEGVVRWTAEERAKLLE